MAPVVSIAAPDRQAAGSQAGVEEAVAVGEAGADPCRVQGVEEHLGGKPRPAYRQFLDFRHRRFPSKVRHPASCARRYRISRVRPSAYTTWSVPLWASPVIVQRPAPPPWFAVPQAMVWFPEES
jgi:hypothetical protein